MSGADRVVQASRWNKSIKSPLPLQEYLCRRQRSPNIFFRSDLLLTERKMPERNESPAVQSLRKEQKRRQRNGPASELDKALENTFPASDPASVTHTSAMGAIALEDKAGDTPGSVLARRKDQSGSSMGSNTDLGTLGIGRRIREKPIASVLAAMAIGFAFGLTR